MTVRDRNYLVAARVQQGTTVIRDLEHLPCGGPSMAAEDVVGDFGREKAAPVADGKRLR